MPTVLANVQYHINVQAHWEVAVNRMVIVIAVAQGGQVEVEMGAVLYLNVKIGFLTIAFKSAKKILHPSLLEQI